MIYLHKIKGTIEILHCELDNDINGIAYIYKRTLVLLINKKIKDNLEIEAALIAKIRTTDKNIIKL